VRNRRQASADGSRLKGQKLTDISTPPPPKVTTHTINQWFVIASLDDPSFKLGTQYDGLADSADHLLRILTEETGFIPPGRIILGHGFVLYARPGLPGGYRDEWMASFPARPHRSTEHQLFSGSEAVFDTAESGERSRDGIVDALLLQRVDRVQ
jgi:hypothetical protein